MTQEVRASDTGRVTLPAEAGMERQTLLLTEKWGADAIRDSDGTRLSPEILKMGYRVYSTLCLVRADQDWAYAHRDQLQQKFLISDPVTTQGPQVEISPLEGHLADEFELDRLHDAKRWWEVIDRTTGQTLPLESWRFDADAGKVIIDRATPWHVYTVNFLAWQTWDETSMYNHLLNKWTCRKHMGLDPRNPRAREHMLAHLDGWLTEHPDSDMVRLTSVAYHFANIRNERTTQKYIDWYSYQNTVSPLALEQFEKEKGYRLRLEDLVQGGTYASSNSPPTPQYLDYIDFVNRFVVDFGRQCTDRIHRAGKKAMMFYCDHWVGTEPYGPHFEHMGLDAIVGPCRAGVESRVITGVPAKLETELRLYPYFFPLDLSDKPVFAPGGDPVRESRKYWMLVRRALLRDLADRIGYGGYLSLAMEFPEFLDHVKGICREFRQYHQRTQKTAPHAAPFKVAVLNAWGSLRSWKIGEYQSGGLAEAISGLPFDVRFIRFEDIERGVGDDIGVVINTGDAGSAWSGGDRWARPAVVEALRAFVHRGGGFIGVGEPTALQHQGRFFQLFDVLGVQKETGLTRNWTKPQVQVQPRHFITADLDGPLELGHTCDFVYPAAPSTEALAADNGKLLLAANTFGRGRSVYFAGFRFGWTNPPWQNVRLLLRAVFWAASRETAMTKWFSSNPLTECHAYPRTGQCVVTNHTAQPQTTTVTDGNGNTRAVTLDAFEARWL